jgi:hypothetical protein
MISACIQVDIRKTLHVRSSLMTKFFSSSTRTLRHVLIAASALTLVACATATPYQPASEPGGFDGFSQQMIENDRARITFGGNSLTKRDTVENYLLYRSAEMAIERGFESFTLQERDVEADRKVRVTPGFSNRFDPYFGYSFYRPRFGWSRAYPYSRFRGFSPRSGFGRRGFGGRGGFGGYDPFFDDIDVQEITKYRATAEVKFGRGSAGNDVRTFNAREVLQNLGPAITFPEETR